MTHDESRHPRGLDGRWVTKAAAAPAASLPTPTPCTGADGAVRGSASTRMAKALWGYGIAHEPRAREFDLDRAARAGFDPTTGDLEDWRVLDIDDEPLPENSPQALDTLQPDETGRVIVLDSQGDYWARQGDGAWRQIDPLAPDTVSGPRATSEALTDWHAPLLRATARPTHT